MGGKNMEGSEEQKQATAREAKRHGESASEIGASTGASHQRNEAQEGMSHQQRLDLKREGKVDESGAAEARPGSRDPDTPDREQYPRM